MNVQRCTEQDIDNAIAWQVARGAPAPPRDIFPPTGWCVPGVAAWWLYLTDSTLAWTEMLTGSPHVSKEERRAGLDAVIERLIHEARENGVRLLLCNVDRLDLEERAIARGYRVLGRGQTLLGINLMDGGL